jgi:hypothetical protein
MTCATLTPDGSLIERVLTPLRRFPRWCDPSLADRAHRQQTRPDRFAIDLHRARAALRDAAAELRAGHAQDIAQHPKQRRVVADIDRPIDAIDFDRVGHSCLHPIRVPCSQGPPSDAVLPQTHWATSDNQRSLRYVRSLERKGRPRPCPDRLRRSPEDATAWCRSLRTRPVLCDKSCAKETLSR